MHRQALRDFIAHHDERWLFVVVYIGLAVVLSIVLSLFWLVAVAGLHFGLECLRQKPYRAGTGEVVTHALWEIRLDIALVLLALAMALYMDVVLGLLGLQSAARAAAATRITRFAAWERNLRAFVLLADDVARVMQIAYARALRRAPGTATAVVTAGAGPAGAAAAETARTPGSWRDAWSTGDRLTLGLLAVSAALIVLAPVLTQHSWGGATLALLEQLQPFPAR